MRFGECCPQCGNGIQNTTLMGFDTVGVSLHHQGGPRFFDGIPSDIECVTDPTFREDNGFGTIQVFGVGLGGRVRQNPSSKRHSPSPFVVNWKHDPVHELIVITITPLTLLRQ